MLTRRAIIPILSCGSGDHWSGGQNEDQKAKLAAPSSLVWNGCNMGWGEVTSTSTGTQAETGAVKGYTLNIYKNGALHCRRRK